MAMLRTNKCDVCGKEETETSYGIGWNGWSSISGIAAKEPLAGENLTHENMNMAICPEHTKKLADMITILQKEYE
ncbi:hypothetical protein KAR91_47665 [Candidatus Pacearchaeota archaeon]|nr:hypothetical protein [Candidatus Pacearchaeota archaeon]